jgi:hypothetical protein
MGMAIATTLFEGISVKGTSINPVQWSPPLVMDYSKRTYVIVR